MKGLKVITENCPIDCEKLADAVYEELGQTANLSIELSFVEEYEIRNLNKAYRNIDKVTDVLSFPMLEDIRHKIIVNKDYADDLDEDGSLLIGSVAVCVKRAEEQAAEYGHSLTRELTYLSLHGFLHCFGYDHIVAADEAEMTALAEKIMNKINVKR